LNSLPDDDTFRKFLETSLVLMAQECAPAYRYLCEVLAPRQVAILVDGEEVALAFAQDQATTLPLADAQPVLHLQMGRSTILDLTDGKFTLQEAILDGAVAVYGDLKDLVLFHEGWLTYMRGAIRCPSFPDLLERFRAASSPILG
jgi:hypothetical protein